MDELVLALAPAFATGFAVQQLSEIHEATSPGCSLMPEELNLRRLTIGDLAQRCACETELFFQRQSHDPRFCFELFRRAIEDGDEHAWECLYAQYSTLVTSWVQKHSMFASTGEDPGYFANRAFEKLWTSLPADRFGRFPDLKSLLRYLQMCVHSVIVDYVRAADRAEQEVDVDSPEPAGPDLQDQVLERIQLDEFWRWLNAHLHDEKERIVVHGSFVLNLKPRELYSQYSRLFSDVAEIYRVKQNVLARLRRVVSLNNISVND